MEIKTDDFWVEYQASIYTIFLGGEMRLGGVTEYTRITELLNNILQENPPKLTLNLEKLQFLNSSGITVISKFVIQIRKKGNLNLFVQGSEDIYWQKQSLNNLKKLLPDIKIEYQ